MSAASLSTNFIKHFLQPFPSIKNQADQLRECRRNLLRNIINFDRENMEVFQLYSLHIFDRLSSFIFSQSFRNGTSKATTLIPLNCKSFISYRWKIKFLLICGYQPIIKRQTGRNRPSLSIRKEMDFLLMNLFLILSQVARKQIIDQTQFFKGVDSDRYRN